MNTHRALSLLTDIQPAFIADADAPAVRRFPMRRIALVAACLLLLCMAISGLLIAAHTANEPPLITSSALYEESDEDLVTIYDSSNYLEACYTAPRNGDVLLYIELTLAMQQHEQEDVLYWVAMDIFPEEGCLNFDEAATDAEVARLAALGYDLYTHKKDWIGYWGENKHYTTICLKMSADELYAFEAVAADDRFGYAFEFATVDVADCTPVHAP